MNSARVRARYVLPTPVGPRKTNEPIGHFRDDVHHVVRRHHHFFFFTLFTPFVENGIELFLRLLLLVTEGCSFFEILRLDRSFLFHPDLFYFLFDALHVWRPRHGVNTSTRAGLIHYIDRLVGEKSSRDIAIGKSA